MKTGELQETKGEITIGVCACGIGKFVPNVGADKRFEIVSTFCVSVLPYFCDLEKLRGIDGVALTVQVSRV